MADKTSFITARMYIAQKMLNGLCKSPGKSRLMIFAKALFYIVVWLFCLKCGQF
jgi:hypothetical protein